MSINLFHQQKNAFGLEIGAAAVKVLELKKNGEKYKLIGRWREKLPPSAVHDGEIKDEAKIVQAIKTAIKLAKPRSIKSQNVIFALPENKTFIKTFQIPKLAKENQDNAILAEIEKYIPFSINDVYFDWQIIKSTPRDLTIFLAACPKKIIESYQNVILKTGLSPQIFDTEAAAEARALIVKKSAAKNNTTLICDIGETKTLLIVCDNGNISFTKTATNISGSIFTETVAKDLKIKKEEAEKLKISCCSPEMSTKERQTLSALHSVLDNLANETSKVSDYYQASCSDKVINEILLCGGGAATIGIAKYLALKSRKKVKIGNPWINIPLAGQGIDLAESLAFTKTIGLALRGTEF
jgi:type IV pilus assembly protein PilM